jgi:hypothetical protein
MLWYLTIIYSRPYVYIMFSKFIMCYSHGLAKHVYHPHIRVYVRVAIHQSSIVVYVYILKLLKLY